MMLLLQLILFAGTAGCASSPVSRSGAARERSSTRPDDPGAYERVREAVKIGSAPLRSPEQVQRLLELCRDSHPDVRAAAATALGNIRNPPESVVSALIDALRDPWDDVRIASALVIERRGSHADEAVPLLAAMLHDPDDAVALRAGLALKGIGAPAIGVLTEAAIGEDDGVAEAACNALGQMYELAAQVAPALVQAFHHAPLKRKLLYSWTLQAIGADTPDLVSTLLDLLPLRGFGIRSFVSSGLSRPGSKAARRLVDGLRRPEPVVRAFAALALGSQVHAIPETAGALAEATLDREATVRTSALLALWGLVPSGRDFLPVVLLKCRDDDEFVRLSAFGCLRDLAPISGELAAWIIEDMSSTDATHRAHAVLFAGCNVELSDDVRTRILGCIEDPDSHVRSAALLVLNQHKKNHTPDSATVATRLADPEGFVRADALRCLCPHDIGIEFEPVLRRLCSDPEPNVRELAVWQLSNRAKVNPDDIDAICQTLDDPDPRVRSRAAFALTSCRPPSTAVVRRLACALGDADTDVRHSAAHACIYLTAPCPELVPALLVLLGDEDWMTRTYAVEALALVGNESRAAFEAVSELARSAEHDRVRDVAIRALAGFGHDGFLMLEALLQSRSSTVREEAVRALGSLDKTFPEIAHTLIHCFRTDRRGSIRAKALEAVSHRADTDPKFRKILEEAKHDPNEGVRKAASMAIRRIESARKAADGGRN